MTDKEIKAIFTNVMNGVGNHGDFLRAFAEAICRADAVNFIILVPAAISLVRNYNLYRAHYLEGIEP